MLSCARAASASAAAFCVFGAMGQTSLFSNASVDPSVPALNTSGTTASGVVAPNGGVWSEVTAVNATDGNALAGVACSWDASGGVRAADNFTVPAGQTWTIDEVWLYAYQTGWGSDASPVASATVQVWYGQPGTQGAAVVWGNSSTNRLGAATSANMYRVFTTEAGPPFAAVDSSRKLFKIVLNADAVFGPGEYWLDWQLTPVTPGASLFAAAATLPDARTGASWNAVQLADGVWAGVLDPGKPVTATDVPLDIVFQLRGSVGTACDSIDFNGDGLLPDTMDIDDFISVFAGGTCPTGTCNDIDFNNDGLFPDVLDIDSMLSVFSGGPCL